METSESRSEYGTFQTSHKWRTAKHLRYSISKELEIFQINEKKKETAFLKLAVQEMKNVIILMYVDCWYTFTLKFLSWEREKTVVWMLAIKMSK